MGLSFASVNSGPNVRFYKVYSNGDVKESINWGGPSGMGSAKLGSPIVATAIPGDTSGTFRTIHVFFLTTSGSNTQVQERYWNSGGAWSNGALNITVSNNANLSANSWIDSNGDLAMKLYATNTAGNIQEYNYDVVNGWATVGFTVG